MDANLQKALSIRYSQPGFVFIPVTEKVWALCHRWPLDLIQTGTLGELFKILPTLSPKPREPEKPPLTISEKRMEKFKNIKL